MPKVIGSEPHPRALLFDLPGSHVAAVAACFPVSQVIYGPSDAVLKEWDVIVCGRTAPNWIPPSLYVISFGHEFLFPITGSRQPKAEIGRWLMSPARELVIPDDLPLPVSSLVHTSFAPAAHAAARSDEGNSVLVERSSGSNAERKKPKGITPFLFTKEEQLPIAGRWSRGGGVEVWSLPSTANWPSWISAALEVWNENDPVRFPQVRWTENTAWATPEELRIGALRDHFLTTRSATLLELDRQIDEASVALKAAREEADNGLRALLLTQGDDLVLAVATALKELGFEVQNMDTVNPPTKRLEDLRVSAPEMDWTVIVEVRGYKGGAAVNDLMRIQRFALRYTSETGRPPDAAWYVVNQFVGRDPSSRESPLHSNPEEAATFAESNGLVMDTTELFRLLCSVRAGPRTPAEARKLLMGGTGVLKVPHA